MGFKVFRDDWNRLESGNLYLSDCTSLDRRLDRQLIEYIALHGHGWWMTKFRRRYGLEDILSRTAEVDDPLEFHRTYLVLLEQVAREDDREVLEKAAFENGRSSMGKFAFCRLTGYSWDKCDPEDCYTYRCGLKRDMLREDIEKFCVKMTEEGGPFAPEAEAWLKKLDRIPDETLDEWAAGQTEWAVSRRLNERLEDLLRPLRRKEELCGDKLAETIRDIFDAYILMIGEERFGKVTRDRTFRLMEPFTRNIFEIMKKMNRSMITDETAGVIAILSTGRAMRSDITREAIREIVWTESDHCPQHSFFLGLAYQYGIGTKQDKEKAAAAFGRAEKMGITDTAHALRKDWTMRDKTYDVIHIGEVNHDFTVPGVPEDFFTGNSDTYTCGVITDSVGGDAGNQSICMANLGDHIAYFGRFDCGYTGDRLKGVLEEQGVDTSLIVRSEDCRTRRIIVNVRNDGSHRFLVGEGSGYGLRREDIVPGTLDQTRVLAIGSLFVLDALDHDGLDFALKVCRDAGGIVVADMTCDIRELGPRFYDGIYRYIDFLVPSWDEASYVTGEDHEDRMADFFLDRGAGNVIIKLGSKGSYFKNREKSFYTDPFVVTPVDTTGCGDNFTAGFIHTYLKGQPVEECVRFASAAGALNSLGLGSSSYIRSEQMVLDFMEKTQQKHIER